MSFWNLNEPHDNLIGLRYLKTPAAFVPPSSAEESVVTALIFPYKISSSFYFGNANKVSVIQF